MARHNRIPMTITLVALALALLPPLTAAAEVGDATILCQVIDCSKFLTTCPTPKIDAMVLFSNVTPGGVVAIKGCGFGNTKWNLRLLLKDYLGGSHSYYLTILDWTDTFIGGTIPSDITGVKDQVGELQVTMPKAKSKPFQVNFRAAQDYQQVSTADVTVVYCPKVSDYSKCNKVVASDKIIWTVLFLPVPPPGHLGLTRNTPE